MNKERDAYTKLFEHIDKDLFFQSAIEDIVYIDDEQIQNNWEQLKNAVFKNKTVFIRGYGRGGKGTDLYFKLYNKMFGNKNVKKDSTNNAEPTKLLKKITQFSKTKQEGKTLILNYQISHLFGKTKNPLLFTCPWNIAYIPKYIDPFTGHETQGQYSEEFKQIILPKLKEKFKIYIDEYNLIIRNEIINKIEESLNFVKAEAKLSNDKFKRFETDVRNELSEI
jgi:hypothetical protein